MELVARPERPLGAVEPVAAMVISVVVRADNPPAVATKGASLVVVRPTEQEAKGATALECPAQVVFQVEAESLVPVGSLAAGAQVASPWGPAVRQRTGRGLSERLVPRLPIV